MADRRLNDEEYKRWMKCVNGLSVLHSGVSEFVEKTSEELYDEIKQKLNQTPACRARCGTTDNKGANLCQECKKWFDEIMTYKKGLITWTNSKASDWSKHHWEVSKLYMGKGQDKGNKKGPAETDTSALLQLIKNNKFFIQKLDKKGQSVQKAISSRNELLHSSTHKLTQADFDKHIDVLMDVLKIQAIANYPAAVESRTELEKLKNYSFDVTPKDELAALRTKMEEINMLVKYPQTDDVTGASGCDGGSGVSRQQAEKLQREFELFLDSHENLRQELHGEIDVLRQRVERIVLQRALVFAAIIVTLIACVYMYVTTEEASGVTTLSLDNFDPAKIDYKSLLNTLSQKNGWKPEPKYESMQELNKDFKGKVTVNGKEYRSSTTYRKKQTAEQEAAYQAYVDLKDAPPTATPSPAGPAQSDRAQSQAEPAANSCAKPSLQSIQPRTPEPTGPIDLKSSKGKLADFLRKNGYQRSVYRTENSNGKFHSMVEIRIPYLWAVENPIRGKGQAEHAVARLILDQVNDSTLKGLSDKEKLKTCSDRKGIQQPKYYTTQSRSNQQDYYCIALFKGLANTDSVFVKGQLHDSEGESEEGVAKTALDMLQSLGVGSLETSALETGSMGTSASPTGQSPRGPVSGTPSPAPGTPQGKSQIPTEASSPQTNFVGKLKEFTDKEGSPQPNYDSEVKGNLHRFSVTMQFKSTVCQDPPLQYNKKKVEAEKYIALAALQQDFPEVLPETLANAKNRLQELCVALNVDNKPGYITETTQQGFISKVVYMCRKKFQGPDWVDNSKRAKQEAAEVAYNYVQ